MKVGDNMLISNYDNRWIKNSSVLGAYKFEFLLKVGKSRTERANRRGEVLPTKTLTHHSACTKLHYLSEVARWFISVQQIYLLRGQINVVTKLYEELSDSLSVTLYQNVYLPN